MAKRRGTSGRVTPKGTRPANAKRPVARDAGTDAAAAQVGRRPSNPGFLVLLAIVWIVVGVVLMLTLDAGWKFIPGIVSIGIGLLFLRGAAATVVRRQQR